MNFTDQELIDKVASADLRAVARLITLCENHSPRAPKIQAKLFPRTGKAHVIGVTGSPGAGKSTLVDELARVWKSRGKRVGVIAVDPTSPFSGGAILGDRIRMSKISEDPEIFIRSMATRGSLGGISRATIDAIMVLDAAGFDIILVETVGVGQAEVDIVRTADTVLVVLVPGMGDSVQVVKAGILEIADLFVINKADRDGADMLQKDLTILLSLVEYIEPAWKPLILRTTATVGTGVAELVDGIAKHIAWFASSPLGPLRKMQIIEHSIIQLANDIALQGIFNQKSGQLKTLAQKCFERKIDPFAAAMRLLDKDN